MSKIDLQTTDPNDLAQAPLDGSATGHPSHMLLFQLFQFPTSINSTFFNLLSCEKDALSFRNPTAKNCLKQVDQKNLVLLVHLLLLADWRKLKLNLHSCNYFKMKKKDPRKNKYNVSKIK